MCHKLRTYRSFKAAQAEWSRLPAGRAENGAHLCAEHRGWHLTSHAKGRFRFRPPQVVRS